MAINRIHILGFKSGYDGVSGTFNTRDYADRISEHLGSLSTFFGKKNLIFTDLEWFVSGGFPNTDDMIVHAELWMDDGRQHQLYALVNRTITETTGVV